MSGFNHAGDLRTLRVALINPRFDATYFGLDHALPLMPGEKRYWTVTGALPYLAGLTPAHCHLTLIDENTEALDFEALAHFDVVGLTGMNVQGARMLDILRKLKGLGPLVVVGGPYVSVAEGIFADLCDVRFVGEAEETWPQFLNDLAAGRPTLTRYEQAEKTDMTRVPPPRFDLIETRHYLQAPLQFSRGCPFLCEFCDIITIFGRKPRTKTPDQMIAEFEALRAAGFRTVFLSDDNFIGNKKDAKALLRALIPWQKANGYPLALSTEASINLAEDDELMELMTEANFRHVFIGIESPRAESLKETRKMQNLREASLEERIQKVRDKGLVVNAGFIVGFDNDDENIFDEMYAFIQKSGVAQATISILTPIPSTPLYDRLLAEGRLDFGDPEVHFHPKLMSREALKAGYEGLLRRLYEPEAFFERFYAGYRGSPGFRARRRAIDALATPRQGVLQKAKAWLGALQLGWRLLGALAHRQLLRRLGGAYAKAYVWQNLACGRDALPLTAFVWTCLRHWHYYNIVTAPKRSGFAMDLGAAGSALPSQGARTDQRSAASTHA